MGYTTPKTYTATILTVSDMNTYQRDNIAFLRANIELDAAAELTIASGIVTFTKSYHRIDTESDAATDDLDTINVGADGRILFLRAENAARTVVLKDGTGNLDLGGKDISLIDTEQVVALIYDETLVKWNIIGLGAYNIREFPANVFQYPAAGTDWTPQIEGARLGASLSAKKCWLPLNFLKLGDQIISYKLVGDTTEAAGITLDCKLVSVNKADPITTTDIAGGAITQVTAHGNFDVEAVLTSPEIIVTDKQYTLEILGTTAAGDELIVMGAEVKVVRLT